MSAFKRLQSALQNRGYSKESAGAIAASQGRKKWGVKVMQAASKKHISAKSAAKEMHGKK